jgi:hypothetical protein
MIDFSRKMWVYLLKAKSECFERFKEFKALAEKEVDSYINRCCEATMEGSTHPTNLRLI